ncbi:MAG: TIGR03617 family F420-dependent LLM class oxidoreductase [Anaerolineales bacterium]|nr:TIGR03617 family F420-dependent LLM class oxidoreductase [Anaerolineales bacterium]
MKLDVAFMSNWLGDLPALARSAEDLGFDAIWTSETQHDPFLPLALAAEHTQRVQLGTAVAIGFARSPMTLAHTAWDLAHQSRGRFILGLGTQVKAHIERRFGMSWPESPVHKLREMILAIRAVWASWQTGERLNFRGEHFKLTLMSPFFNPGAIDHPHIPIYIAGVNTGLARLCGEVCDGFHAHPFHTAAYLKEVMKPAIEAGAASAGRTNPIHLSASVFVITSPAERDFARSQVAFYASTPSYRSVLEHHGWGEIGEQLSALAARGEWGQLPTLVSDEMLNAFAVEAPLAELAEPLRARYAGVLERVTLYRPYIPKMEDAAWRKLVADLQN